ncbi:MAG TPA: HlyD family secretion protein [Hyphomonas sp.]|nr:HlyD family secretion protein [Hyphomonas sp.]HRI99259.1 HlyD family secretion protein [Hyphomonas sp.]
MDGNSGEIEKESTVQRPRFSELLSSPRNRRLAAAVFTGLILLLGVMLIADRTSNVATSDARIAAEMIAISTDISGRITSVGVREGDRVKAGDVIYTIDDREAGYTLAQFEAEANRLRAEISRAEARAGLATSKAGSQIAARAAGTESASASVEAARSNRDTAKREYDRVRGLFERGLIAQSGLDQARNALETAEQALHRAQADRATAAAEQRTANISGEEVRLIDHDLVILQADLDRAVARVEAQKVLIEHHTIRAPTDGVIDELFYDPGEHSLRGFRMALMHNPDEVWVSANIKETDIRHIRIGAPVTVRADSDPSHPIRGRVTRISNATLAEAAMMPNPNANGVFTKITQRISVRVDLDPNDAQLRPGTMVRVRISRKGEAQSAAGSAP